MNKTLIALIPKCPNPESINNYRPIGLCNSVYTIVTKVIIARFRPLFSSLISPVQAAFVLGRRGLGNIIIAQELIHSIDKKGKKWYMAIKVDLEKAYDRLKWNFIHKVLQAFHFPDHLIKLIMSCISSRSISILFNGGAIETFSPRDNIGISHLFFADDLMLFAKASRDNYEAIMEVLECFRAKSG